MSKEKLKFSKEANAKLVGIKEWSPVKNPKVYSISLLSGFSCPGAKECQTYAIRDKVTGKRTILDGKYQEFRCFSASQEAQYKPTYNQRKHNLDLVNKYRYDFVSLFTLIQNSLPKNATYIRVHVGGDFVTEEYMLAWYSVARFNSQIKFYAYTKSIQFMVNLREYKPDNFSMNASEQGKEDDLIHEFNLKSVDVVKHPSETKRPIDHNEDYAINDKGSFSLLLHGTQKQGSESSKALSRMKREGIKFSYSRTGA